MLERRWAHAFTVVALLALALLITACAQPDQNTAAEPLSAPTPAVTPLPSSAPASAPSAQRPLPPDFPHSDYTQAAAQGQVIYAIDSARSLITLTVRRGGTLARLGHDHIIASRAVQGFVAEQAGRADLFIPLNELTVDEAVLRAEAGLDTQPSASDIAGTRANLLNKVLHTEQHPFARVHIQRLTQTPTEMRLAVTLTLHGVSRTYEVLAQTSTPSDAQHEGQAMQFSGEFEFNQSDFGITPFSILGGLIQVQDRINLRFRIHAGLIDAAI